MIQMNHDIFYRTIKYAFAGDIIFDSIHLYLPLKISDKCQLNFQKKHTSTGTS